MDQNSTETPNLEGAVKGLPSIRKAPRLTLKHVPLRKPGGADENGPYLQMAIPIAVVLLGYGRLGTHAPAINRIMDYQPRWSVCLC